MSISTEAALSERSIAQPAMRVARTTSTTP
jgi:hypothetical protein